MHLGLLQPLQYYILEIANSSIVSSVPHSLFLQFKLLSLLLASHRVFYY
jgi:hypothetical protein